MALAREQPAEDSSGSSSSRGLTLFLVPVTRDERGRPQVGPQLGHGRWERWWPRRCPLPCPRAQPCVPALHSHLCSPLLPAPAIPLPALPCPPHVQGFEVVRLKDKLGTRQLPTAELRLAGMRAIKVGRSTGRRGRCQRPLCARPHVPVACMLGALARPKL